MPEFYVTFPQKDAERKNKYTVIEALGPPEARQAAFDAYGNTWAFIYPQNEYKTAIEKWDLKLHERIVA